MSHINVIYIRKCNKFYNTTDENNKLNMGKDIGKELSPLKILKILHSKLLKLLLVDSLYKCLQINMGKKNIF